MWHVCVCRQHFGGGGGGGGQAVQVCACMQHISARACAICMRAHVACEEFYV